MEWLGSTAFKILGWFLKAEDLALLRFFAPLILQVKNAALQAGKGSIIVGLNILKNAALTAVLEAQKAETNKVKVAEEVFLKEVKEDGIEAINNAAAGLIKAAVANIQIGPTNTDTK